MRHFTLLLLSVFTVYQAKADILIPLDKYPTGEKRFNLQINGSHVNPAKRKAMAVKNEKRFLKQKRNALKNPGYSHHPVKTQASFKRLLKAV